MSRFGREYIIAERTKPKLKPPSKYKVVMHNDDYTPMDFVIEVLKTIFGHNDANAQKIMWDVHTKGRGIAGVYTKDIAETKAAQTMAAAKIVEHPFLLTVEKE